VTKRILLNDKRVTMPEQKRKVAVKSTKNCRLNGIHTKKIKNKIKETKTFILYFANRIFLKSGLIIKWSKKEASAENKYWLNRSGNRRIMNDVKNNLKAKTSIIFEWAPNK
jgi:hypothetical protein